jgi:hypothetical protein
MLKSHKLSNFHWYIFLNWFCHICIQVLKICTHIFPNVSWTSTMVDLLSMWQLHFESHGFIYHYLVQFQHLQSIFHTLFHFIHVTCNTICKNRWPKTKKNCNMHFNLFCITFEKFFLKIPNVFSTTNLPLLNVMLPFSMWGHN